MSLRATVSITEMRLQQTPKARIIVHRTQRSWQHVSHPRICNSKRPVSDRNRRLV